MKLLPCARMISATSKGGRFISCAAFRDRFTWSGLDSSDVVERSAGRLQMALETDAGRWKWA